jgi:hypothetical protein
VNYGPCLACGVDIRDYVPQKTKCHAGLYEVMRLEEIRGDTMWSAEVIVKVTDVVEQQQRKLSEICTGIFT